jgi:hypothetical protein
MGGGKRPSGLLKLKVVIKGKKPRTQINEKFNHMNSTDENK